ncbi:hypothetical protein K432DRAFT_391417 [Lepidopterella palustris CBS 459.81]|uniref:DUF7357 domain-containing protein n=1 Tax=Lepidopterella palustris CBS 459.81 TaxID=1314670 RepID=A0A8E2EE08_9PEZI|nr:hypothetical protein K432DRAFT_391417 [Lepidopterella palustris CBS 459.81]
MRLRLSIKRHALPPTEVLWTVPDDQAQKAFSIARLLEEINHIVPLESENWGLEDYVVEVGGYECLHFSLISQVLKDEDEVCIRSLQTSEIRARTLSGRYQISEGGQHLIDGIPFGRPYLRQPNRPAIHIPPRKRPRLTYEPDVEVGEINAAEGEEKECRESLGLIPQSWKFAGDDFEDDEDSEDDEDFTPDGQADSGHQGESLKRKRTVRFAAPTTGQELTAVPSENEDSEEEYDPHWDTESSEASNDEESEAEPAHVDLEDDSDISSESDQTSEDDSETESSSASSAHSDSSASDNEGEDSQPEEMSSKFQPTKKPVVIQQMSRVVDKSAPHKGKARTQYRNIRRREAKMIRRLKMVGALPPTANRDDLLQFQAMEKEEKNSKFAGFAEREETEPPDDLGQTAPAIEEAPADSSERGSTKSQRQPKNNSIGIKATPEQPKVSLEINRTITSTPATNKSSTTTVANDGQKSSYFNPEPAAKRARLDLAGSRRLVFGSLGVRNPKTKADEEKIKEKLMAVGKPKNQSKKPPAKSVDTQATNGVQTEPEDPEAWKTKINLTAFECWDEDIELSTPPFPFKQRWDPQQQYQKGGRLATKNKKRKRAETQYYHKGAGTYGEDASSVYLNYDEEEAQAPDTYDVDTTIESQLQLALEEAPLPEDLPPLPADPSTLPAVSHDEIKIGNVIAFRRLECSQETNWAPVVSPFRTAKVEEFTEAETIGLRLALRDQPLKKNIKHDEKGKRLYEKFEMDNLSDEDEEEQGGGNGLVYEHFEDLIEPKLLQDSRTLGDTEEEPSGDDLVPKMVVNRAQSSPSPPTGGPSSDDTPHRPADIMKDGDKSLVVHETCAMEQTPMVHTSA